MGPVLVLPALVLCDVVEVVLLVAPLVLVPVPL